MCAQRSPANLESFACFWLDSNVHATDDNRQTEEELRQVINYLRTFDDSDECEAVIRQITKEKVVLIVSGALGQRLVPRLHDLAQFSACYVFCLDKELNEQWATRYHKVIGIFSTRPELMAQIYKDQLLRTKLEDGPHISVIRASEGPLQARNATFLWFQLFIEVLLRLHYTSDDQRQLIQTCKNFYQGNGHELKIIEEFEQNYKPEDAIWWYTRESCFYRMMNKALRVQDYETLFSFGSFIADLATQLRHEHENFLRRNSSRTPFRVFRGQAIDNDELELMKSNVGKILSMNAFVSTSRHRSTALTFAGTLEQRVIFEIQIEPQPQTKAFGDIGQVSYAQDEGEVLIMMGALFRIGEVKKDENDGVWIVQLYLANEGDYELKEMFSHMKETIGEETDLDSLGKILFEMGDYEQSKKFYERMSGDIQMKSIRCQVGLGKAADRQNDGEAALSHYNGAMKMAEAVLDTSDDILGEIYSLIGGVHCYRRQDYDDALIHLKKAQDIQENSVTASHSLPLSTTYHHLGTTYDGMSNYESALKYLMKALKIRQVALPADHHLIAATYNNIGCTYHNQGDYAHALQHYGKSLQIKRCILPPDHPDLAITESNISLAENDRKL